MSDPRNPNAWVDIDKLIETDNEVDQEWESLDEIKDEEFEQDNYVEGIDNWEDWN
jgi:hypothetical protein